MQMHKFDIDCPPWALPREEIPLHVKINKEVTPQLKNVIIDLPDCFRLVDTINIVDYETEHKKIIVNKIGKAERSDFDYFGVVVASEKPFTELKKEIPINIEFEYNDGTKDCFVKYARIFRPLLTLEAIPKNIILSDKDGELPKIPLSLKFTGFGEISLRVECQIEGKIASIGTSMLDEVLRRILNEGLILTDNNEGVEVKMEQNYVENMINQLKEKLKNDEGIQRMIREQQIDKETAEALYELSREDKEKIVKVFFKTIEGYITKIVSDILRRNPSDNLQIESQTSIYTRIKLPTTNVTIKLIYRDLLNNEYEPIEKIIQITDKRKNPSVFNVEIPLEIGRVDESKAYKNVGTMKIGTHG